MPEDSYYQYLADQRARFGAEMKADPDVRDRLFGLTHKEVGSQGEAAQDAFVQGVMNRASSRGQTLRRAMASDYYPASSRRYVPGADYQGSLDRALAGSNSGRLNTGNAEGGSGVTFAGGPRVLSAGGEDFGIEGPDVHWAAETASQLGSPLSQPATAARLAQPQAEPPAFDSRSARTNFMHGQFGPAGSNIIHLRTEGGRTLSVHSEAAPAFKGFVEDLEKEGAPLGDIGSYAGRTIAGSSRLSQHAYGNALDLFDQEGRDIISPAGRKWIAEHPKEWRGALDKWGMVSGGDWRNPDLGHVEWSGQKPWLAQTQVAAAPKPGSQAYWESTRVKPAAQAAASAGPAKPGSTQFWNSTKARPSEVAASHSRPGGLGGGAHVPALQPAALVHGISPGSDGAMAEVDFFDSGIGDIDIEVEVPIRVY